MNATEIVTGERADLLSALGKQRHFMRYPARGLSDEQAAQRTTVSELTLGGLIKHVTITEGNWARFIVEGPSVKAFDSADARATFLSGFRMTEDETLARLLERYDEVAARTDELVRTLPDLDAAHRLPDAPWFEAGASWSARRVLLHIIAE